MPEVFIKTTQEDRCSGAVYHTLGTLQQDLLGNRRTKGVKQLNADLNNPIYSSLETLAVPSGGLIPDRLLKLPCVWQALGCGSAQETIGGAGRALPSATAQKKPAIKTRVKPLAACPTPVRWHQPVLGASEGGMELEGRRQSWPRSARAPVPISCPSANCS